MPNAYSYPTWRIPSNRFARTVYGLPKVGSKAIHICSKMEFLEHGKEKAIVSFKNRRKLAWWNINAGIQTNSKSNTSCADSNLGPGCEGSSTSKDLPRLGPRDEARKSETRREGEEK
ncbi:hypothetical protein AVEN_41111-1 [Araneus ventricosus]|uniref:Uncharacterized protein n=1 Tax=Araneus ventricosus TaxID=182803 RepID=A0A4Y2E818_ARAVE|nr:hypothetical protein AVEN_41111-1 [Araneus ventricosus]